MYIDFHTHTFPEKIAGKTMDKLKTIANIEPACDATNKGLIDLMVKSGVSGSVILPVVTANRQFETINRVAAELNQSFEEKRNAFRKKIEKGVDIENTQEEKWLFSFGGIHPDAAGDPCGNGSDSISAGAIINTEYKEQLKIISELGLKGIKVHPDYHNVFIDDIRYLRIFDKAAELGLWVVSHAGWDPMSPELVHCSPERVLKVMEKIPTDRFILAHLGGWYCTDQVEELLAGRNIWFDTSMLMSSTVDSVYGNSVKYVSGLKEASNPDRFLRVIAKHGSDRLLWGTDCPWENPIHTVRTWEKLLIAKDDNDKICYKNAMNIIFG